MSNVIDGKTRLYFDRVLRLETEKRERAVDIREVKAEMKSAGLGPDEIAGVMLAVRQSFEDADKKAKRTAAEDVADALSSFADSPLGAAAVQRAT